jgi:hypothetical protein
VQQCGDVITLVLGLLVVVCPLGRQQGLTDTLAVEVQFVQSERRSIQHGVAHLAWQCEGLAQHRRWKRLRFIPRFSQRRSDPGCGSRRARRVPAGFM